MNKKIKETLINIGTGIGTSVLELINTFQEVNGCKVPHDFCNRRPGDVDVVIADNAKALKLLEFIFLFLIQKAFNAFGL